MTYKKKIAVYRDSFNPPHLGDISVIESLFTFEDLAEIWLIPWLFQDHFKIEVPGTMRVKMLTALISDKLKNAPIPIQVSDFETKMTKELSSYQIKLELERAFPQNQFIFVIGQEILHSLSSLKDGTKFLVTSDFIVFGDKEKLKILPKNVKLISNLTNKDITSAKIRGMIYRGEDVSSLVSPSVLDFIQKHDLYKKLV